MDAVTFTQERMKRQIEDLQDKQDKVQVKSTNFRICLDLFITYHSGGDSPNSALFFVD